MKLVSASVGSLVLFAVGCAGSSRTTKNENVATVEPATPDISPSGSRPEPSTAPADRNVPGRGSVARDLPLGSWESPACGTRNYPRQIAFRTEGEFNATDLVSPCPRGVVCLWSGIVEWQGTWKLDGATIVLTIETKNRLPDRVPREFRIAGDRIAETAGSELCSYARIR